MARRVTPCANWQRLVPSLVRLHTTTRQPDPEGPHTATRDGRRVHTVIRVFAEMGYPFRRPRLRPTPVNLYFRRGFLEGWRVHHAGARAAVAPEIARDQPFARCLVAAHSEAA